MSVASATYLVLQVTVATFLVLLSLASFFLIALGAYECMVRRVFRGPIRLNGRELRDGDSLLIGHWVVKAGRYPRQPYFGEIGTAGLRTYGEFLGEQQGPGQDA